MSSASSRSPLLIHLSKKGWNVHIQIVILRRQGKTTWTHTSNLILVVNIAEKFFLEKNNWLCIWQSTSQRSSIYVIFAAKTANAVKVNGDIWKSANNVLINQSSLSWKQLHHSDILWILQSCFGHPLSDWSIIFIIKAIQQLNVNESNFSAYAMNCVIYTSAMIIMLRLFIEP